jgi:hypothetical protein
MTCEEALRNLIDAWESLPTGDYNGRDGFRKIDDWLNGPMLEAIREGRKVLLEQYPKGNMTR